MEKIVHIVESDEDHSALCSGEVYSPSDETPPGTKVTLCPECWYKCMHRGIPEEGV